MFWHVFLKDKKYSCHIFTFMVDGTKITLSFTFEGLNRVKARNKKPLYVSLYFILLAKNEDIEIHYFMICHRSRMARKIRHDM